MGIECRERGFLVMGIKGFGAGFLVVDLDCYRQGFLVVGIKCCRVATFGRGDLPCATDWPDFLPLTHENRA